MDSAVHASRVSVVRQTSKRGLKNSLGIVLVFLSTGCGLEDPNGPREPVPPGGQDWGRAEEERLTTIEEECGTWIHPGKICPDDFGRPEGKADTVQTGDS